MAELLVGGGRSGSSSSAITAGFLPPSTPLTVLMPKISHPISPTSHVVNTTTIIKFKPFTRSEKEAWLASSANHGFIRVYEATSVSSTTKELSTSGRGANANGASVVVPCTLDTTCKQICQKLAIGEHELHAVLNGDTIRRLDPNDRPLRIQNAYLENIGISEPPRQQGMGDSMDLCYLVKFCAGRPVINDEFGRSTLNCYCHVRKGRVFHHWTKRFCVLNSARLLIYPGLDRAGTPDVIALSRAKVEDIHLRSRGRCIKITVVTPRRPVQTFYIAFDSAVDLNTWLARCMKGSAKVPPVSDLSNLQLEYLPEQVFCVGSERLLTHLNLRRNCLKRRPPNEDSFTVGWLEDLARLESLRSLNLADNDLRTCPMCLFDLNALTELVLTGNKLMELPPAIGKLTNLQTMLLQNNWLSRLPTELIECRSLSNLDLSFNRFAKIPEILGRLKSLENWTLSGNEIEKFMDENLYKTSAGLKKIELRRCKLIQNAVNTIQVGVLPLLTHLDIRDNRYVTSLDLKSLPSLQVLNCQRCSLFDLQLNGSALTALFASKNNLRNLVIMPVPKQLKVFDVAYNDLNKLPEWLTELTKIERIVASHNRLVSLPCRIFTSVSSIKTLILNHNNISALPHQVENCFIEYLDLHHNKLTQLPLEFLASAHKLKILNLSENLLTTLPPLNPFLDLNKVQQLYLTCNRLNEESVSIISGYRRLRVLDLAYNCIRNIDDNCMEKLQLLESINLSGNRLRALPPSLACAPNLTVLRAHSNRLAALPDFSRAPCLKVLDCGSNQLEIVDVRHLLTPQLKHLDVSCNPKLRLDTSAFQQFRSERLVSLIDMSRESRSSTTTATTGSTPINSRSKPGPSSSAGKPPWQAGFSETSGERNKLCVSQIRIPSFPANIGKSASPRPNLGGAVFGMIDGGLNNELPQYLAAKIPELLRLERSTSDHEPAEDSKYLKYTLLRAHQSLRTSGQKMGASTTVCHLEMRNDRGDSTSNSSNASYVIRVANCGHTEAFLCRKGKPLPLTKRFLIEDAVDGEIERLKKAGAIVTEENELNGITPCSRLLGCNFLYPAVIPDPHVIRMELDKTNDEFLLLASRGLWEVMSPTEAVRRIRRITNPILAAKHLQDVAQSYGYKENLSILVVRFHFNAPPIGDSSNSSNTGAPPSTTAPSRSTNGRCLPGMVMSAIDMVANHHQQHHDSSNSDEYSFSYSSDEDVKSEPRDAKLIREPPNYYFEYKKQLKQLMQDVGSSDAFSLNDDDDDDADDREVPESLYSVATLVRDDDDDQDERTISLSTVEFDQDPMQRRRARPYMDDGYQSSDLGISRDRAAGQQQHPDDGLPSNNSSCSSGLGKSSAAVSPEQQAQSCAVVPRWKIDDREVLEDSKLRFHQARQSIISKLNRSIDDTPSVKSNRSVDDRHSTESSDHSFGVDEHVQSTKSNVRPQMAKIGILGDHQQPSAIDPFENRPQSTDFVESCCPMSTSIYETPNGRSRDRQPIYEQIISRDDGELFTTDDVDWTRGYPATAHSDDQIQCSSTNSRWNTEDTDHGDEEVDRRGRRKYPTLIVANIDIDGSGPQNLIIRDPDNARR